MSHLDTKHFLRDYTPPFFCVQLAHLELELGANETRVRSKLHIRKEVPHVVELLLDAADDMQILQVRQDGIEIPYQRHEGKLQIVTQRDQFVLEIENSICPQSNTQLEGLYVSGSILCTQCEPEGFRRITPFVDRPDNLARFTVTLIADRAAYPQLLSNGHLVASWDVPGNRHAAQWDDPFPKPSYLFAVVAGDLVCREAVYTTQSGRQIMCRVWVEPHNRDRADHALFCLLEAMAWDERTFDRECDLDLYQIVAVDAFNAGAMENKGLNIFNSRYVLATHETATDADYDSILRVVGHEYFHNWSGNRVTLRDWFQLSLKEGLTVFRDQEFTRDMLSAGVKRVEDARLIQTVQFIEDAGPLAHPVRPESYVDINNFYTHTVYEKGAEVVRMLQNWVGVRAFREGLNLYFARHDHQAVTVEDFIACISEASGQDVSAFLAWYQYAGTPQVTARCDIAGGRARLSLSQCNPKAGPDAPALPIPVMVSFIGPSGEPVYCNGAREVLIPFTQKEMEIDIDGICEGSTVCWLSDFSAPVQLVTPNDTPEDRLRRALAAPDAYNRWYAMDSLAQDAVRQILTRQPNETAKMRFWQAVAHVLDEYEHDEATDPSFGALLLQMPSEMALCQMWCPEYAPEAVCDAVDQLALETALHFAERLEQRMRKLHARLPASWGPHSAWRTYKNQLFSLWTRQASEHAFATAWQWYEKAANMSDRQVALVVLCRKPSEVRHRALMDFHARFGNDINVLAMWFSVQSASPAVDTLTRVQELRKHANFDWHNPNLVRALIRTFANNIRHFYREDGAGYDVLVSAIQKLSFINDQVAASLVRNFSTWHMLPVSRSSMLLEKLQKLHADPTLTARVREPLSSILKEGGVFT